MYTKKSKIAHISADKDFKGEPGDEYSEGRPDH